MQILLFKNTLKLEYRFHNTILIEFQVQKGFLYFEHTYKYLKFLRISKIYY